MTNRQAQTAAPEQLTLLAVSELPIQFRLDQRTRERGLAHIAAIRRQLAAKASGTTAETTEFSPQQHKAA
jgi:hypothetical protein